jgi:hypothetical protein
MLPPLLIFKGAANGRIAKNELSMYPDSGHYLREPKAWMDEHAMTKWIDLMLVPWKNLKLPGSHTYSGKYCQPNPNSWD